MVTLSFPDVTIVSPFFISRRASRLEVKFLSLVAGEAFSPGVPEEPPG